MEPNFSTSALYALDNLEVMRGMDSETVHLIYADPPFNSKRIYQGMAGTKAAGHRFRDTWSWNDAKEEWLDQFANDWPVIADLLKVARSHSDGMAGYLAFMAVRVIEMQRALRPDGSLYLHCDTTASSYLRNLLDCVFGSKNFRNEIVWRRYGSHNDASRRFGRIHDTILFYSKEDAYTWTDNAREPYDDEYIAKAYREQDATGRYATAPLHARQLSGGGYHFEWRGVTDVWRFSRERLDEMDAAGLIHWPERGRIPRRKVYLDETKGVPARDMILDIKPLSRAEHTGWQTQKPLALLERIIKASSNPGDIVFDPFCGCGTALVAAEQLGRRWVGADDDANAVDVIKERIANLTGTIGDSPQLQHSVRVIGQPPARTVTPDETVYRDPTGYIVPALPSDKMTNAAIREQLLIWQTEPDGFITCIGCAERLKPRHFECDHIDPKAQGGSNRIDNRIMLCGACNGQKSNTKALAALWTENGVRGAERKRMQGLLAEVRSKARLLVQQVDAGAAMQQVL